MKFNEQSLKLNERRTLMLMHALVEGKFVNLNGFLKNIGISKISFNKNLKKIENSMPDIYNDFINKYNTLVNEHRDLCKKLIISVNEMAKNGVCFDENSEKREFDVLDWYYIYAKYFDGLSRNTVVGLINEIEKDNVSGCMYHARRIISKSFPNSFNEFSLPINANYIMNDNSFKLTDEEKKMIIDYFVYNRIPFNTDAFYYAAKRVINSRDNNYVNCFKITKKIR